MYVFLSQFKNAAKKPYYSKKQNNHHKINGLKILKNSFYFRQTEIPPSDSIEENANDYEFFRLIQIRFFRLIFSHSANRYKVLQYDVYSNESANIKLPNGYDEKNHIVFSKTK